MSIVERALRRLQSSGQARPPGSAAPREPKPLRAPPPAAPIIGQAALVAAAAAPAPVAPAPRESLPTSIESLRAAGVLPLPQQADVLADQFRRIKWPVLESVTTKRDADGNAANVIMVTSSVSGEGKTFSSLNLALSIAWEKDYSVLLIDADVAKRHITSAFGAGDRAGLTDVLSDASRDPQSLVLGTGIRGLTFLPAGKRQDLAPELFASQRMLDVIRVLRSADPRRIVLFDTSPLLATNESQVLAKAVDQVVLVVRAESTTQPMVLEAVSLLDRSKEIRCILNQAHTSDLAEYYYGYGKSNPYEAQEG
jgi:protein-tyrosine kinase